MNTELHNKISSLMKETTSHFLYGVNSNKNPVLRLYTKISRYNTCVGILCKNII